jgi:hypothetical protein
MFPVLRGIALWGELEFLESLTGLNKLHAEIGVLRKMIHPFLQPTDVASFYLRPTPFLVPRPPGPAPQPITTTPAVLSIGIRCSHTLPRGLSPRPPSDLAALSG